MAPASTLSARPQGAPARQAVQRAVRTYSWGFAAVLAIGMLVANIATVHGGFGVADQLANVAPMAIAAMASAPSIIAGGFDISISPLILLTNAVYIVWLVPNGLGGAVSVPIILGLGLAVGVLNGLLIMVLRVQAIVVTLAMFFSLQGVEQRVEVVLGVDVDAAGGIVQQQDPRSEGEPASDDDALLVPAGQRRDRVLG